MKLSYCFMLIFAFFTANTYSQVLNLGEEALVNKIKNSKKDYKLIYIFCNYCQASQERFPQVAKRLQENDQIDFFPICGQDSFEIATYMDTCRITAPTYLINQNRKRKMISFYNPIKAACRFIEKNFPIKADKMGASAFFILNKENQVIIQTDWSTKDEEYYRYFLLPYRN